MTEADLILCELLVLRLQRQDPSAARELVGLFERPLLYFLRRLVQSEDDAWDLYQETWISVFRALPKLRDSRALPAFLYRTARNHAVSLLRRRGVEFPLEERTTGAEASPEPDLIIAAADAAAVHDALDKLSMPHREVLTLFFLQDLSVSEIANVVGVPVGTVKSRLYHAKKNLKSILSGGSSHGE